MAQPDEQPLPVPDPALAAAVDATIAEHGGDARAAVATLLEAVADLEAAKESALGLVSKGFARGRLPG
ncbi:hypothetical protein CWB41_14130 [Methylovirgula ligni]|uniref:Uncharacterized protein n=1 Tax=Methylovirgula ligni TaxID=569860 RepID=A0A3D9YKX4_9HYPH|nr:hypothetical protein [Methylovirgula ligni]QAY96729.1 hypothetical protein CWB41_14130 [Methylovirgula ligni]REF83227.1 hypothetical protein DES32_3143 [Methylovirgula ligni]